MKRIRSSLLIGATALAGVITLSAGCITNPNRIFIKGVMSPPAVTEGACIYEPSATGPFLSSGTLDVAFASTYDAGLLVGNQMIPRSDPAQARVETNRFIIQGTVVRLTDSAGSELGAFTSYGAGVADPASGGQASYGVSLTTLVDSATAKAVGDTLAPRQSKTVIANVSVFGVTTGAINMESAEFQFPISICNGCLVRFPPDSVDTVRAQIEGKPNCAKASTTPATTASCHVGQDSSIDCRSCQGYLVCDPNY